MEGDADCVNRLFVLSVHPTFVTFASLDTRKLFFCFQPVFTVHRPLTLPLTTCHHLDSSTRHPDIIPRALDYHLNKVGKKNSSKMADVNMSSAPAQRSSKFFLFLIHLKADFERM